MSACVNHDALEAIVSSQMQVIDRLKQQLLDKDNELRQQEMSRLETQVDHEKKLSTSQAEIETLLTQLSKMQEERQKQDHIVEELKAFLVKIRPVFLLLKEKMGLPKGSPEEVLRSLRSATISQQQQ
mmetsp:Transcript_73986/g.85877  ORF Transcript_73986/g.85877 Transcript_73986/m.85877 type:complete len:127 (-) Transcript_73986:39-419(-)